jgi:hypothetical protein
MNIIGVLTLEAVDIKEGCRICLLIIDLFNVAW